MRELLPGGDAFGATIWLIFIVAEVVMLVTVPGWQARNGGPAGVGVVVGLLLGLAYAHWHFEHRR